MTKPNKRPWLKFLLALSGALLLLAVLAVPLSFGESHLPALGCFLNPYEGALRSNDADYWDHDLDLPGLRAPVDVYYDARLVPHIYASSLADLYYVQGYVQAQHRLFQFDITARAAEGRLSEVLGERTRELDLVRRRIGGGRLADQIDSLWKQDAAAYEAVSRYAEGVNAYISQLRPVDYPIEYKLLDFAPEPWSPRSTALVAINMAYTLNFSQDDVANTRIRDRFGLAAYDFLFPQRTDDDAPIIPAGTPFSAEDTALLRAIRSYDDRLLPLVGDATPVRTGLEPSVKGIGSNNWVVGPTRTASGDPLLANDPHLSLTLPSIWFEGELHAEGLNVHGVSLPGVPGITIGFNEDCAWGVTNVGHDVLDWHEVVYTDAAKTRHETGAGTTAPVARRVERIKVRGAEDVVDSVLVTAYGPVVYTDTADARAGLAMDWLTLRQPSAGAIRAFLQLNTASTLQDFIAASQQYEWPAQNMVFANRAGDIALRISGTLPRELPRQGEFVRRVGEPALQGYLASDLNPIAANPPQGYLASANQITTAADYPYPYRGGFDHHRGRRINQLLGNTTGATVADMKRYQLDDYGLLAAETAPQLLALVDRRGLETRALGLLAALEPWRYEYSAEDFAPVIFEEWLAEVDRRTWDEFTPLQRDGAGLRPANWRLSRLLLEDPGSTWFDDQTTPVRENASAIVTAALVAVAPRVDSLNQIKGYAWADLNAPAVSHLTRMPAFSRTGLRIGGRAGALNAQTSTTGPSWRMIVDLSGPTHAEVVYPGGQSGRPGNPHYDDFVDVWAAGQYFAVRLHPREELEASAKTFTKVRFRP